MFVFVLFYFTGETFAKRRVHSKNDLTTKPWEIQNFCTNNIAQANSNTNGQDCIVVSENVTMNRMVLIKYILVLLDKMICVY